MPINKEKYKEIITELQGHTTLVAVSKTKPVEDIKALYDLGQRDFGENYVQELVDKAMVLPQDIRWHFIGHLQSNKIKYIAPFVHLIHGIDSIKLLQEVNKQAIKLNNKINVLLQIHIAEEKTKFGLTEKEMEEILALPTTALSHTCICGIMGMATFSNDVNKIKIEFRQLKTLISKHNNHNPLLTILSMGMSGDYQIAIEEGSNMVRIGSLLFGER